MNKFTFWAVLAITATTLAGCSEKAEVTPAAPALSIDLESGVLNVSNEGETVTVSCTVTNPVEGGSLSATTEADWLTLSCNDTNISVEAAANVTLEEKSATVNVSYTYGDGETVSAEFTVKQDAMSVPDADYQILDADVAGKTSTYMGMSYFNLYVAEEELPEDLSELSYNSEYIYYVFSITDVENEKPAAGTHEIGTVSGYVYGKESAPYGAQITSGTLTISYDGDTMTLIAELTDKGDETHFIYYMGTPRFE